MSDYKITGTRAGSPIVKNVQAASVQAAKKLARLQGIEVTRVQQLSSRGSGTGVKRQNFIEWTGMMADFFKAGILMDEALGYSAEAFRHDRTLLKVIENIREETNVGMPLPDCMRKYPALFDAQYIAMVEAGLTAGALAPRLKALRDRMDEQEKNRIKFMEEMAYPVMLLLASLAVFVYFGAMICPALLKQFGPNISKVPVFVIIVMKASVSVAAWGYFIIPAALFFTYLGFTSSGMQLFLGRLFGSFLPPFQRFQRVSEQAELFNVMSMCLNAGVDQITTLRLMVPIAVIGMYGRAVKNCMEALQHGEDLAASAAKYFIKLDPLIKAAMIGGTRAGNLPDQLARVSTIMNERSGRELKKLLAFCTSVSAALAFAVAGGLTLAVYAGLYSSFSFPGK